MNCFRIYASKQEFLLDTDDAVELQRMLAFSVAAEHGFSLSAVPIKAHPTTSNCWLHTANKGVDSDHEKLTQDFLVRFGQVYLKRNRVCHHVVGYANVADSLRAGSHSGGFITIFVDGSIKLNEDL